MQTNDYSLSRKALIYLINLQILNNALKTFGGYNQYNPTDIANMVFTEVTNAANSCTKE